MTRYFLKFLSKAINAITDGNSRKHLESRYFSIKFLTQPEEQFPGTFKTTRLRWATNFHIKKAQAKIFYKKLIH